MGKRIFDNAGELTLKLKEASTTSTGIAVLTYDAA
jgi:hypothetical protein